MKKYLMQNFYLDDYVILKEEVKGGTRPRLLVKNKKNNHKYILKSYSKTPRELWVELFASKLGGKITDITVQEVTPKILDDTVIGELKKQFSSHEDLKNIAILIRHAFPTGFDTRAGFEIMKLNPRDILCLDEVYRNIFEKYSGYGKAEKVFQSYIDMVVFDALIGNMDRHLENWGVHESKQLFLPSQKHQIKENVKFTTLFDHGSAGLFELPETKVKYYLENDQDFYEYYILGSGYSLISQQGNTKKVNIFSILKDKYSDKNMRKYIKNAIDKVISITHIDIAEVIFKMPVDDRLQYSRDRQELLFRSTIIRQQELKKIL